MAGYASSASAPKADAAVALVLALLAAGCLVAHTASFLLPLLGNGLVLGAAIGMAQAAYLGYLAADNANDQTRTTVGLVFGLVLPVLLVLMGIPDLGYGWLGLGGIASSLVIPVVQWCCDTQPLPKGVQPGAKIAKSNPIPGAMVAGILLFAMPGGSGWNVLFALGYFGVLILVASMGDMMEKGRQIGRSVSVDPQAMMRWLPVALVLLLLSGTAGVGVPVLAEVRERQFERREGTGLYPIPERPGGQSQRLPWDRGEAAPRTQPDPNARQQSPSPQPGQSDRSASPRPPPPPPPPDYRELAIKALILLLAAALLLWVARKYGQSILRFLDRTWKLATAPIYRWLDNRREKRLLAAHEAKVLAEMDRQGDPFAPLPQEPEPGDLPAVYRSLAAAAYLLGTEQGESETVPLFVNRLADSFRLDRRLLATVAQVCSRGAFAPSPPTADERIAASTAATTILKKVESQIPEATLSARKEAYRRLLAERALATAEIAE